MTAPIAQTTFGLLRHAQTEWNREKRIQGQADSPLSEQGQAAARGWGVRLAQFNWHHMLVSDLGRARQTARLVNTVLHMPQTLDARLREQDWGHWTGRTLPALRTGAAEALERQEAAGWRFCPPDGESREAVWRRSRAALIDAAGKWPGAAILVVTHEGVVKSLIYRLLGRKFLPPEGKILQPGRLHWLTHDAGGLYLHAINAVRLD